MKVSKNKGEDFMRPWLLMLLLVFGLSACGQKGDLYLPKPSDPPQAPVTRNP